MPPPSSTDEFLALVAKSDLLPPGRLDEYVDRKRADRTLTEIPMKTALALVQDGLLTKYQAEQLLSGRWRNFTIGGKYKLLERLGKGGMALVFLCEHKVMKRLVALKILPTAHNNDKELLGRFHREARALSSLRHPNIVGAYDADQANQVHFLVMEYVDGGDLDQIVQKAGPLSWERATDYIRQAAHGLQHAHECGLVHRDVKPGNVLVDRSGTVKLLDLGLARIFHESTDDLTTGRDAQTLLGTVDYLAPEQALNSHDVDIRADIYGLGATFYFILTARGLFEDGTVAQKLSWHLHRPPVPIADARPDLPEGLIQVIDRMLAKKPDDRYQTPAEVVDALEPWNRTPIAPPDPSEFPSLSRAVRSLGQPSSTRTTAPLSRVSLTSPLQQSSDRLSKVTQVIKDGILVETATTPARLARESAVKNGSPPRQVPEEVKPPLPLKTTAPAPTSVLARGLGRKRTLAAGAVCLLTIVIVRGWFLLGSSGGVLDASRPGDLPGEAKRTAATKDRPVVATPVTEVAPPSDRAADASIALTTESGARKDFPSLREAIKAAKPGDRVVVTGSLLIDSVELTDVEGVPRDLTIEGVVPGSQGRAVRWRGPREINPGRPLLDVSGLEGFHLKGFLFDGQGRVADLLRLSGRGAGATLEDLRFEGSTRAGVVLRGWLGESGHPATIRKVRFATTAESEAAILVEADPDRPTIASEFLRVLSCRFEGPYQAALLVSGPVDGLEVEQCRFYRATDGLRYRRSERRDPIRVRLANNTFADLQRGIHFETTPPSASSELVIANNIFANTTRAATLDRVSIEPGRIAARWIWSDEGRKTPTVPPGVRLFRKSFDLARVPDKVNLDISCDETFVAWLNGTELMNNPSPYFTQRVFSVDVARLLKPGRNVLAVQGTNQLDRLDSKFGTTAGLLAQLTTGEVGPGSVLLKTDETWKSADHAPPGWNRTDFDDRTWPTTRLMEGESVTWPWKYAVWDSTIKAQLKPPLEPIKVVASGNVRDYKSWEGYPTLDSERVVIQEADLARKPGDDATFLHYPVNHPLATAGPGGVPLGASDPQ